MGFHNATTDHLHDMILSQNRHMCLISMFIILIRVYLGATVAMMWYYQYNKITTLYAFNGGGGLF